MRKANCLSLLLAIAFGALAASAHQDNPGRSFDARCLIGLQGLKHNAEGTLAANDGTLHFSTGKSEVSVSANSIESVIAGSESTEGGGRELEVNVNSEPDDSAISGVPPLQSKVDVLTVVYHDQNGGIHAAIFALPKGSARGIAATLVAKGAHSSIPDVKTPPAAAPAPASTASQAKKLSASGILVEPVNPGPTNIPAEFRMAIYENLVEQLQESGLFHDVYRSGDRRAANVPDLLTLRTTVEEFKKGSELERQMTYYALGGTKIGVNVQVLNRDGAVLLERKVVGRVVVLLENLSASHFVAVNIKNMLRKNF